MKQWFVLFGSEAIGPLTSAELRQLARDGGLRPDSQISRDSKNWHRADSLKNLTFQSRLPQVAHASPKAKEKVEAPKVSTVEEPTAGWKWWILPVLLLIVRLLYLSYYHFRPLRPKAPAANAAAMMLIGGRSTSATSGNVSTAIPDC